MKVMILAIVRENKSIDAWRRTIEMPVAPIGLQTISAELGKSGILLKIEGVGWSEKENAFILTTEVLDGKVWADLFRDDKRWESTNVKTETIE